MDALYHRVEIENEISYLRLFDKYLQHFEYFNIGQLQSSAWKNYPTQYKFIGAQIFLSQDLKIIQRETYDALTFTGDCGGFFSFLAYMGYFMTTFFGEINMWKLLTNKLYKFDDRQSEDKEEKEDKKVFTKL